MNIIVKVKKIGIILLATLIFFTGSFTFPLTQQKAHAFNPLAVPAGIQIGTGVYVTGALITAGAAGLIGYDEYSEEINAHAKGVWEGGTQTAKDSLLVSINAAMGAGNKVMDISGEYMDYLGLHINTIADSIAGMAYGTKNIEGIQFSKINNGVIYNFGGSPTISMMFSTAVGGKGEIWGGSSRRVEISSGWISACGGTTGCASFKANISNPESVIKQFQAVTSMQQLASLWNRYSQGWGMVVQVNDPVYQENYNAAVSQTREAWEGMRDAGLVLPVDSATAYVGDNVVKHNPANDTYTTDAGAVYSPSDVTWSFPTVIPRTDGVPVPGLYTDSPALTGNPAIDKTIVDNPAIPKTTTNINTGVTTSNPDYVGEGNPPLEGGVPPTNPPPSKWEKPPTKKPPNIGALITTKFPFSLPWDFFGVLGWINAEPKAPVFKLDTGLKTPFGKELKMDMEFKFNFLDPYMGFFRGFIIIGFSLFLILATRRLLGGAG